MMKRATTIAVRSAFAASVTVLLLGIYLYTKDYSPDFVSRKGRLANIRTTPARGDSLFDKSWLMLSNDDGFKVGCGMLVPKEKGRRYPAIVLLGGKATGKYAVDYALDIKDVILVSPDYPYEPRASYTIPQFIADVPEIRQALFDMIPSVMLLTDYLWTRPDVDTTKLILLGYSFGAPFVPAIIANDRRAAIAAMVYGAGDMRTLIRHNVNRYESAWIGELVGGLSGLLLHPIEPMRHVDRISPIPLVMINGTEDEQIPRANVDLLYNAAKQPKSITWLESKHVHPNNPELTRRIVATLNVELRKLNVLP